MRNPVTEQEKDLMVRLYEKDKLAVAVIGARVGRDSKLIKRVLKERGVVLEVRRTDTL